MFSEQQINDSVTGKHLAPGLADSIHEPIAQHVRASLEVMAAAAEEPALGNGIGKPPHPIGIVRVLGKIRGQSHLDCLITTKISLQHLRQSSAYAPQHRPESKRQPGAM